jgi:transmembrane sensor
MNARGRRKQAEACAAAWVARREWAGWSKTDQAALSEWIGQSLDHRVAWLRLSAAWEQTRALRRWAPAFERPRSPQKSFG